MIYVYQKKGGAIVSAGKSKPPFVESDLIGIIEIDQVVPQKDLSKWRILKGKLCERSQMENQNAQRAADKAARQAATAANRVWAILDKDDVSEDMLKNALRIIAERVIPRR